MKYLKALLISIGFVFILMLYFNNELNKSITGVILDSFWINFVTILYLMFLHYIMNTSFSDKFHKIRHFEKSGKMYRMIGVKVFKYILANNPYPTFTAKLAIESFSVEGLCKLEKRMRDAEAIHFQAFVASLIVMIPFGLARDYRFFYFMTIFNIINNLYPVFVQRYNRNRINRIIEK